MINFALKQPSLPILNNPKIRFPIHRIFCIGRNYREHAIEMGHNPEREPPFFFQKSANCIVDTASVSVIPYPPMTTSLHYEGEVICAIDKEGLNIKKEDALNYIFGYGVGCDLTRRDIQKEAKKLGRPWTTAKSFDYSAPCSPLIVKADFIPNDIRLEVNGTARQYSSTDKMIWSISEMIQHLSQYFRLLPGDLIMTGTPSGVGECTIGDTIKIYSSSSTTTAIPTWEFTLGDQE